MLKEYQIYVNGEKAGLTVRETHWEAALRTARRIYPGKRVTVKLIRDHLWRRSGGVFTWRIFLAETGK